MLELSLCCAGGVGCEPRFTAKDRRGERCLDYLFCAGTMRVLATLSMLVVFTIPETLKPERRKPLEWGKLLGRANPLSNLMLLMNKGSGLRRLSISASLHFMCQVRPSRCGPEDGPDTCFGGLGRRSGRPKGPSGSGRSAGRPRSSRTSPACAPPAPVPRHFLCAGRS